jgi:lipopolysaccharide O-acetyltransferase
MNNIFRIYGIYGSLRLAASWLYTKIFYRPARLIRLPVYLRGKQYICWGKGFTTGPGLRIDAFVETGIAIYIGDRVQFNDYVHIAAIESVTIGNDVLIASKVFITDHNHGSYGKDTPHSSPTIPPASRPLISAPVVIGDRVWLGENVSVLPGVTIGEGVVVAANSVVTHDLPPNTIAAGAPARIIKHYDSDSASWISISQK